MVTNIAFALLISAFLTVFLIACHPAHVVGDDINYEDISDLYYTVAKSTNPPFYQRYRVFTVDGAHTFYHERREGDHWPLTENDAVDLGKVEMNEAEWSQFCQCVSGGKVTKRTAGAAGASDGSSGPGLYIYWGGDKNAYQVFTFANVDKAYDFRKFCEGIMAK